MAFIHLNYFDLNKASSGLIILIYSSKSLMFIISSPSYDLNLTSFCNRDIPTQKHLNLLGSR